MFPPRVIRKPREFVEARRLRAEEGLAIKAIAREVGVSPATASIWVRDITLSPDQARRNLEAHQGPKAIQTRALAWSKQCRDRRLRWQAEGAAQARTGDLLHAQGCMLYWAEGSKDRNQLTFANSDEAMVRLFRRFLVDSLDVEIHRLRARINAYTETDAGRRRIQNYWLEVLRIPTSQLTKCQWNHYPTSSSGSKRGKLRHGVCTVRVTRSTQVVQHIFGAIEEYGQFERAAWRS